MSASPFGICSGVSLFLVIVSLMAIFSYNSIYGEEFQQTLVLWQDSRNV